MASIESAVSLLRLGRSLRFICDRLVAGVLVSGMGISRYISRRYVTLLRYLLVVGCFFILYRAAFAPRSLPVDEEGLQRVAQDGRELFDFAV